MHGMLAQPLLGAVQHLPLHKDGVDAGTKTNHTRENTEYLYTWFARTLTYYDAVLLQLQLALVHAGVNELHRAAHVTVLPLLGHNAFKPQPRSLHAVQHRLLCGSIRIQSCSTSAVA